MNHKIKKMVAVGVMAAVFQLQAFVAVAQSVGGGADCSNTLLHLNVSESAPGTADLYAVGIDGTSTFLFTFPGAYRPALAADPNQGIYSIQNFGARRVLTRLNEDGTSSCIPNANCSGTSGIAGQVQAMAFRFDGTLFAADVNFDLLYTINTTTGLATLFANLHNAGGGNASDGSLAIDFAGGDLVVTATNQMIYVRYSDGSVYRVDLGFPKNRAFLGNLPRGGRHYTSLALIGGIFYALEETQNRLQPFTVQDDVLTVLPTIDSQSVGWGDAASCPELPASECALPNILENPDFEAQDDRRGLVSGLALNALDAGNRWDVYDWLPDVTDGVLTSWFTEGATSGIEIQRNTVVIAQSGVRYVELESHPNATNGSNTNSFMSQTLILSGGNYDLSFWYRPRTGTAGDNTIDVLFDGVAVATVDGTDTSQWVLEQVGIDGVSAGVHKLTFHATGLPNTLGGFLDNMQLTCDVPPPPPASVCGNGVLETPEACDDGNGIPNDGCSVSCQIEILPTPVCGDGNVDAGETCDDGNVVPGDGCDAVCQVELTPPLPSVPVCGNGVIEGTETCDDGNVVPGDGCDAVCQVELTPPLPSVPVCGNGVIEGTETCDDGNVVPGDGCDGVCNFETPIPPFAVCGDLNLDPGEMCDDGNLVNGDGCDAQCVVEPSFNNPDLTQTPTPDCEEGFCDPTGDADPAVFVPAPGSPGITAGNQVQGSGGSWGCALNAQNATNPWMVLGMFAGLGVGLLLKRKQIY